VTLHELGGLSVPHHQALELLCTKALERGDVAAAYRLSDRRCRIRPLPEAHCYVLRAEALYRMGEEAAALADLATAIEIAPDDLAANRRLLAWSKARQQIEAAKTLIGRERDMRILRQAIAVLCNGGQTAFAGLWVRDDAIEGWAAWQGAGPIRVRLAGESDSVDMRLDPDPRHPLAAELGSAVSFDLPRTPARTPQLISVIRDGEALAVLRTAAHDRAPERVVRPGVATGGFDTAVTVIVPVYADYCATKECLESVLDQPDGGNPHRVIIVNDASPDRRIEKLLDELVHRNNVQILTNTANLGFVGAINRALREVAVGDIVLLNADTIVPTGFINRLASAAQSSPEIGTVTPLSNNGEFTSFPVPNRSNAAGSAAEVRYLDRIAARVNAGGVVDIPNGIGFCLYVTRACLDAVGALSESYHRGYLEDVDFCLRARQHGFRNVCATSVYVGHAGSRSFGKQKRSLVVRNLEVIEQRFPAYRAECADFVLADPLKAARRAIETSLPPRRQATLLVTGGGAVAEVARERARHLLTDEAAALILDIRHAPGGVVARLSDAAGDVPQSLEFQFPASGDAGELLAYLRRARLARMELFDLARIPLPIMEGLLTLSVPYDIVVAHAELTPNLAKSEREADDPSFWRSVIDGADRLLVPDAQAEAVASSLTPRVNVTRLGAEAKPERLPTRAGGPAAALGLVPIGGHARDHHFIRQVITGLKRAQPTLDIVIAGATLDDVDMFRAGDAFVTGPVDAAELGHLFRRYKLDRILLCLTQPLFGHPIASAVMASEVPVAYVDWSCGQSPTREGDLSLNPELAAAGVVAQLVPWLQG
jgi:GT2 family glycosyltransferase